MDLGVASSVGVYLGVTFVEPPILRCRIQLICSSISKLGQDITKGGCQ